MMPSEAVVAASFAVLGHLVVSQPFLHHKLPFSLPRFWIPVYSLGLFGLRAKEIAQGDTVLWGVLLLDLAVARLRS